MIWASAMEVTEQTRRRSIVACIAAVMTVSITLGLT